MCGFVLLIDKPIFTVGIFSAEMAAKGMSRHWANDRI